MYWGGFLFGFVVSFVLAMNDVSIRDKPLRACVSLAAIIIARTVANIIDK